jgi:hypothetical protein
MLIPHSESCTDHERIHYQVGYGRMARPVGYGVHGVVLAGQDRSFPHVEVAGREPEHVTEPVNRIEKKSFQ